MNLQRIIASAKKKKYLIISEVELKELLSLSKLVIEENTYISDKIRLLKYNHELLLQERTTKDEYLIRVMKTQNEAEDFIKDRLDVYNRMWDGCGCKVKYYD
jgi:hypothetical protein